MCVSCTVTKSLSKRMLIFVVADYCDAQLPLFLTIMERSKSPIIRSNAVIALGDMVIFLQILF
jgi:condensin complex subunit 1